jgi:hypothetical protein
MLTGRRSTIAISGSSSPLHNSPGSTTNDTPCRICCTWSRMAWRSRPRCKSARQAPPSQLMGRAWVDFSARSMQPDGKHDGGDALELTARRNGESKAAKSNTLREARDALEAAARAGEEPPSWVAQIMTEAGWQRYHSLCAETTAVRATLRGGNWFSTCKDDDASSTRAGYPND